MAVEARMTCALKTTHPAQGPTEDMRGREVTPQQNDIELTAFVGIDPEDPTVDWSVWTPSARLEMTVMNPEAAKYFEPGEDYRVVITKMQPQKARQ